MPFIPLNAEASKPQGWRFVPVVDAPKFVPIEQDATEQAIRPDEVAGNVLLNNPATAIGETALHLGSQMVALPVAGLAGLATEAGNALGLTDRTGADVVHAVGEKLTYQPRGEMGRAATDLATKPFQWLAEKGQQAGTATLEATGSPAAATVVDTAIQSLPMAIAPAAKGAKRLGDQLAPQKPAVAVDAGITPPVPEQPVATVEPAMRKPEFSETIDALARAQTTDEIIAAAAASIDSPVNPVLPKVVEVPPAEVMPVTQKPMPQQMPGPELQAIQVDSPAPAPMSIPIEAAPIERPIVLDSLPPQAPAEPRPLVMESMPTSAAPAPSVPAAPARQINRQAIIDHAQGKMVTRDAIVEETGQRIQLRDQDAGQVIGELQNTIDALEALQEKTSTANLGRGLAELTDEGRIPNGLADDVLQATGRYAQEGYAPKEAAAEAIGDLLYETRKELKGTYDQLGIDPETFRTSVEPSANRPQVSQPEPRPAGTFVPLKDAAIDRMPEKVEPESIQPAQTEPLPEAIKAAESEAATSVLNDKPQPMPARIAAPETGRFVPLDEPRMERRAASADIPTKGQAMAAEVQNGTWNPGANYAPFVDRMRMPESKAASVADLPAPKRREHIIKEFASAIGTTVYEGRVKGKNRLGFFRTKNEEVRIKNANDIEVTAHEVAHLIDKRVPELAESWRTDNVLRDELKSVSYDQRNVREGFAEGVRLWMTQPETLEAKAPRVHTWLEDFANRHEYGPAMRKAQADMVGWFGQDALNRARSKIGTEKPLAEYLDRAFDKFRQSTVDDLHGIYQMERELTGKISPNGAYESARLSRASASIADGTVRFGYPVKGFDGSYKFAGKGLEEILQPVAESLDDALLYFVGRSSHELMIQGREHLFTRGEIDAMLKLSTPERKKAFADYQAWNRGILDFAEAQGVINPEARRLWQRTQYLPFHRVEQSGGIKGKPGDWAGIQALTGGTTNIKDVLGNMIGNAAMLLDKAVKNEARLKVANLAEKIEGAGKFMVRIDPGERMIKIGGDQVIEAILKKFGIAIEGDAPAFFEFLVHGQPPAGSNVVAVLRHGKPEWYEVGDPILYRALSAIDRPVQNWLVRMLGAPKRLGQASITLTPDFWMANIARDTLMGSVMSRSGFKPIMDSLKGMQLRMANDPVYKEYIANGGGLSSIYLDEHHFRTKLEKFYRSQGIDYRTVLDTPDKLLTFVETLGDAFEMSTRLGEYKRAIKRGEGPRHAAYLGREVSTDFAMKGDSKALGFMYDTVMFLRPAVVSMDRLFRGIAHDPNKGAIMAKTATLAGASIALYLMNRDDPRYQDLTDWDRDANWHFYIGDQHYRWPKIWEIGAVASVAERATEKLMAEDPQGLGKDFARIVGQVFNLNLMPQAIAPLAEQAMNRNRFTNAPIETPGMENVQPFLRTKPGTSESMKALGMATRNLPESMQVNPVRAEALLRGYLNTWGLYGLMLTDQALFDDKLPEKRTDELPVIRRFYANEPARHTKYETEFYDMLNEAQRLRGTMKKLDEMGLQSYADEKEKELLATEAKPLERANRNVMAIAKDMAAVRKDSTLTPRQKRERLDELTAERNALLKATVRAGQKAQKEEAQ